MAIDLYREILKKLNHQEKEEGNLPLLLGCYRKLLHVQTEAKKHLGVVKPRISKKEIDERLNNGMPVLRFEKMDLSWSLVSKMFAAVVAVFREYPELFGEIPEESAGQLTKKMLKAWYEGAELPGPITARENIMRAMVQATINPFIRAHAEALLSSFDGNFWRRRYCPICGGSPDFASLDKERGSRWLLCSRCDTHWLYQRLECPHCGNQDQRSLNYFYDDKERYRLYVCESCRHYIKAIDLRQDETEVPLPLERLQTLDLDKQAQDKGYLPCGRQG